MADLTQTLTARLEVDLGNWEASLKRAGQAAQDVAKATEKAGQAAQRGAEQGAKAQGKAADQAEKAGRKAKSAGEDSAQGADKAKAGADKAGQEQEKLGQKSQDAGRKGKKAGDESAAGAKKAGTAAENASKSYTRLSDSAKSAMNEMSGKLALTGGLLAAGPAMAVKKFADFDKAMSSVSAATHASTQDLKALREAAIEAGADTAFSAVEAAQGIEELSKAGVSTKEILGGGLTGALDLAAAGAIDVSKAAEIASSSMTQFSLSGDKIPHLADLLAAGAGKAQGGVEDLGMALKQSGLVASQTGLSIEETVGGLTAFASAGLMGSDAGTSFKTMLQSLTPSSKEAGQLMDELGITAYDAQGNFVGLTQFAGNLQNGLKDLSVEQQNAAMKTIFGSDAVRAASVLYKEGAQGVQKWIDAVNDSGYAAETASRMQDNLAGDLEKLGGSLDTVFLKSGSGANGFLRGLVQGAEDLVDAIGKVPEGVLTTGTLIAGLVGFTAIGAGGFMKLTTSVSEAVGAWKNLKSNAPGVASALGKVGKAAGAVGIAIAGLEVSKAIYNSIAPDDRPMVDYVAAVNDAAKGTGNLNDMVKADGFSTYNWAGFASNVNNLGDAFKAIDGSNPMEWLDGLGKNMGFDNNTKRIEDFFNGIDDAIAGAAESGDWKTVAAGMQTVQKSLKDGGVELDAVKPKFQDTFDMLKEKANDLKVTGLSDDDIWGWALSGEVPGAVRDAAAALSDADRAAGGWNDTMAQMPDKAPTLQELADAAHQAANAFLAARDAKRGYEAAVDNAEAAAKQAAKDFTEAELKKGKALDDNTDKGRKNAESLDAVADSAWEVAGSSNTLRGKVEALSAGRSKLIELAQAFGMGGKEAEAYANKAKLIPSKIYTEFSGNAGDVKGQLEALRTIMDGIPEGKSIEIKESNPQIHKALEDLGYKVKTLPDGKIKVTQTGAEVTDKKLNHVARDRQASISAKPGSDSVTYWLNQLTAARSVSVSVKRTVTEYTKSAAGQGAERTYSATGGNAAARAAQKAHGGRLPGHAAGYRLPTSGPGTEKTDGFLGVNHKGMPLARVDAGEWIINGKSSQKYHGLLSKINRDDPSVQGLAAFASGGRVGWSVKDQGKSKASLAKAKSEARAAEQAEKAAQKAYDKIDGKKANKGAKASAKSRLAAAKKRSDKADKALERAEKAYQDDRERTTRLRDLEFDTKRDLYRGDIRDGYGAGNYSGVDRLFEQAANADLSKGSRASLKSLAYQQEAQTKRLTAKQVWLEKKLDAAQSKADELGNVRNQTWDSVKGVFNLNSLTGKQDQWGYSQRAGKAGLIAYGKQMAAGAKTLSSKVNALRKAGFPTALIQQVIEEWTGSQTFELANAMLSMNKGERNQLITSYRQMDQYGARTGQYLTESMYKGGFNAAQGVVKGLESQMASVEKAFTDMAKRGEKAFKRALGIKSPSRVLKAAGVWAGKGAALGVRDSIPENEQAMRDLAQAQAAAYQPQYRLPASAEVQAHAANVGGTAYTVNIDYDRLAAAMSRVQVNAAVNIGRNQAADIVEIGSNQAARRR